MDNKEINDSGTEQTLEIIGSIEVILWADKLSITTNVPQLRD
jgi:hypothetical protein